MTDAARGSRTVSLDDLIALTDEMAALVRAGVPLESGMADVAGELRGPSSHIAGDIARKMQAGQSLPEILAKSEDKFPPLFRAVVTAGIRSGHLAAALEGLATASRKISELRRMTRAAAVYPIFIAFLAFGLFVASIIWLEPKINKTYEMMDQPATSWNTNLVALGETATSWAPLVFIGALLVVALLWLRSKRSSLPSDKALRFSPMRRLEHYGQLATFADVLALLVDAEVPLGEAIKLSADTTGSDALRQQAVSFAEQHRQGAILPQAPNETFGLPPLVGWLLTSTNHAALPGALRTAAEGYRRRAQQLDDRLRLYLPLALTIGIGGTAVLLYAVSMLGPWYQMLVHISGSHR
jgi:general secretion pathway protein F